MDKKTNESRPPTDPEQKRNETATMEDSVAAPLSEETTDTGGWIYVTQEHYDPDEQRDLTTVIVSAIAEAEEAPITEIKSPPLYEVADIVGIHDALFGCPKANRSGTNSVVEFRYNQYKVSVEADGWVTVLSRAE